MKKLLFTFLLAVVSFTSNIVNAASVVVVFAPENGYHDDAFYDIAEKAIRQYTNDVIIGPEIDSAYEEFVAEQGSSWRLQMFPAFADEYDCDYWMRIFINRSHDWGGTHINGHTGKRTDLHMIGLSVSVVMTRPDGSDNCGESASFYSDHGNMSTKDPVLLTREVFAKDLEAILPVGISRRLRQ